MILEEHRALAQFSLRSLLLAEVVAVQELRAAEAGQLMTVAQVGLGVELVMVLLVGLVIHLLFLHRRVIMVVVIPLAQVRTGQGVEAGHLLRPQMFQQGLFRGLVVEQARPLLYRAYLSLMLVAEVAEVVTAQQS
jgi:hypothetical protein